jgi:acylphosphatase
MKTYHYKIKGRVQGVAFRYYALRSAHGLGVKGTIQNLYNGDVEVYAQGDEDSVKRFEVFLHSGPPAARVETVSKEEVQQNDLYTGFEIIY